MEKLAEYLTNNSFEQTELSEDIVSEYYFRSERKKEDERWLKNNRKYIVEGLKSLGVDKKQVADYQVILTNVDKSGFNMDKVLEFLQTKGLTKYLKFVVDENKLTEGIENGEIDVNELTEYAWEEKRTPRLTVKKVST